MKTISANHSIMESTGRDLIIGRALGNVLAGISPEEQCPTVEQMAAFLDGAAMQGARDRFLGHLATCDRCREIHILAHDLDKQEPVRQGRRGWYMTGGTLAVAALLTLAVKLTIRQPVLPGPQVAMMPAAPPRIALAPQGQIKQQVAIAHDSPSRPTRSAPFTYSIAARRLAHAATSDELAAAIGAPASGSYGFAGSNSRQGVAFKAGKELFELELWLATGDKERAGLAGERLKPLLVSMGEGHALSPLDDLLGKLETDSVPADWARIAQQLETLLKPGDQCLMRLGGWVAAARVANRAGEDPYFADNPPRRFLKELGTSMPPAAQAALKKLDKKKSGDNPEQLGRLLDELANAMVM